MEYIALNGALTLAGSSGGLLLPTWYQFRSICLTRNRLFGTTRLGNRWALPCWLGETP